MRGFVHSCFVYPFTNSTFFLLHRWSCFSIHSCIHIETFIKSTYSWTLGNRSVENTTYDTMFAMCSFWPQILIDFMSPTVRSYIVRITTNLMILVPTDVKIRSKQFQFIYFTWGAESVLHVVVKLRHFRPLLKTIDSTIDCHCWILSWGDFLFSFF